MMLLMDCDENDHGHLNYHGNLRFGRMQITAGVYLSKPQITMMLLMDCDENDHGHLTYHDYLRF